MQLPINWKNEWIKRYHGYEEKGVLKGTYRNINTNEDIPIKLNINELLDLHSLSESVTNDENIVIYNDTEKSIKARISSIQKFMDKYKIAVT